MKTQNRKVGSAANQLIDEKSPYLLQHAYNPVKWHPWEDEVFLEARRKDVPAFSQYWLFYLPLVPCDGGRVL